MAQDKKNVRFIRKNGKVIPIKSKDPSRKTRERNYKKYGDGANQAARIDDKYRKKAQKGTGEFQVGAVAGILGGVGASSLGKGKLSAALFALGFGSAVAGKRAESRNMKKLQRRKEEDYVRSFGMSTEGQRPQRTRRKAMQGQGF